MPLPPEPKPQPQPQPQPSTGLGSIGQAVSLGAVQGAVSGLTQIVPAAVLGGPIAGAAVGGTSIGLGRAEELKRECVDVGTRTAVGADYAKTMADSQAVRSGCERLHSKLGMIDMLRRCG